MVRGVIFDLGGTLAVFAAPLEAGLLDRTNAGALLNWLRRRGFHVDDEFVDALVAERQACFARRAGGLQEVTAAEALSPVLRRFGLPHDAAALMSAEAAFFEPELASMRLLPAATELLQRLRGLGLRIGLASNASSHYFVVECCRRLELAGFLDPIVSSAEVGWAKPDPRIFETILSAWALPPAQVVMVGDTPSADIAGANGMSMRSILIVRGRPSSTSADADPTPAAVAADLDDVRRLLESWAVTSRR